MAATTRPRSRFGEQLRLELQRQNLSIRKLSRLMDPGKPEVARRSLAKWISGKTTPTLASRYLVADALGVDPAMFEDDDEDKDADLYADLFHVVRRLARHEAERTFAEHAARSAA